MTRKLKPITPGEILLEEFMNPLEISQNTLVRDTALRFGLYFGTTPEFWLNLQSRYDLKIAKTELLPTIQKDIRPAQRKIA